MREILGNDLNTAFQVLNINAEQKYKGNDYEVWELSDSEYDHLCNVAEDDWSCEWGWCRWGRCILEGCTLYSYTVNGNTMLGYLDESRLEYLNRDEEPEDMLDASYFTERQYSSFTDWLSEVFSLCSEKHIACFAVSLAAANKLTLAEFMQRYQP